MTDKSAAAFRTIGEVSAELGVPQHVLRYWETRFEQLRPVTRAGNRRYYRPEDVALARRIHTLLDRDGYTMKGVQRLLAGKPAAPAPDVAAAAAAAADVAPAPSEPQPSEPPPAPRSGMVDELRAIRAVLAGALAAAD